ncbi:MAG: nitrile hydratase subunit beta [Chloroflexi bacterium]|nr:nitrile hydratase subunit beta [Chloroflexota bacterium]MYE40948.1 nitrile hydratase subunit beta [Chloroflexota bacterium]
MTDKAKVHDMGGRPNEDPIDQGEHVLMDWERRIDSIRGVLGDKGLLGVDELRRAIEGLTPERYQSLSYYQRWTEAVEALLIEKGVLTADELDVTMARQENNSPLLPGEG